MIPCHVACLAFIALIGAVSGVPEGEEDGFCKKSADEDCGKEPEKKFRKTALITGGAGFVAHHVIEVISDGFYAEYWSWVFRGSWTPLTGTSSAWTGWTSRGS